ncbi:MAG: hypothetical protein E6Q06_00705 [Candidatus Moraniibacteriota bacterium]|nr:MAG: hypothetical protein E6Q06_00705 [Candidatus Moranbacteria bacterium]
MSSLQRNNKVKWIARLHFWVMFFSFFLYLGFGFTLGPEFLYQDIRKKFFAFADDTIVVTAVVPGPPAIPLITTTPSCVGLAPRIVLDWADDIGTTSWDIDRDSLPLTTGLISSQFVDTAVVANTSYIYQVTAHGPMSPGIALSALVTATTLDCVSIAPVTVTIETLGGKNVAPGHRANTDLSKRRPKVTGTTNTPNAVIDIFVTNPTIRARIFANPNGYFEWIPPIKLDTGNHILTVTATDPADSARTGSDSFVFWTKNVSEASDTRSRTFPVTSASGGFDFSVRILDTDGELFQEEELRAEIIASGGTFPEGSVAAVFLNDPSRQDVIRLSTRGAIGGTTGMTIEAELPIYLEPGVYRVRADADINGEIMSREATFLLKGLPLLSLGGRDITYAEAASYIGIFFFSLLFLFFFFLLFFVREYWLYLHSLRTITERQLARFGFFGFRKGVIR